MNACRVTDQAETAPKTNVTASTTAASRTPPGASRSNLNGPGAGLRVASSSRRAQTPASAPSAPPATVTSACSASTCRTIWIRPAPRLARMANSPDREALRMTSSVATFAQASSSSRLTTP